MINVIKIKLKLHFFTGVSLISLCFPLSAYADFSLTQLPISFLSLLPIEVIV